MSVRTLPRTTASSTIPYRSLFRTKLEELADEHDALEARFSELEEELEVLKNTTDWGRRGRRQVTEHEQGGTGSRRLSSSSTLSPSSPVPSGTPQHGSPKISHATPAVFALPGVSTELAVSCVVGSPEAGEARPSSSGEAIDIPFDDDSSDAGDQRMLVKLAAGRVRDIFQRRRQNGRAVAENYIAQARISARSTNSDLDARRRCRALNPNSSWRLLFETVIVLLLMWDSVYVPFSIAWQPPTSLSLRIFSMVGSMFWITEMFLSFVTAYDRDGMMVTDFKLIALRYVTTYFAMDAAINTIDVITVIMDFLAGDATTSSDGNNNTQLRIFRMAKLSRLARIMIIFNRYRQKVKFTESSGFTMMGLGMRLIAILLFLNHFISCAWFWMAINAGTDTGATWLDMTIQSRVNELKYKEASPVFQYLTALHWSFTQMTPGSMSVVPQNSWERMMNVVVLVVGLFVSSLLISQLSAKMVRVQTLNHDRNSSMEMLTRFLMEQGVPRALAGQIQQQIRRRAFAVKRITLQDLPSLQFLSPQLRRELSCSIFCRTLLQHTVFYTWAIYDPPLVTSLCFRAVGLQSFVSQDEIFSPNQKAEKVFFLRLGRLSYTKALERSSTLASTVQKDLARTKVVSVLADIGQEESGGKIDIGPKSWISTVALWCNWSYSGLLEATDTVEMVVFNVEVMLDLLGGYPHLLQLSRPYALAFSLVGGELRNTSMDLDIPPPQVMMAMSLDDRLTYALPLLDSFDGLQCSIVERHYPVRRINLTREAKELLAEECTAGKCVVSLGPDGQLLRTVLLCVLNVRNETDEVLYKLATLKDGVMQPNLVLPGAKLDQGESAKAAAQRVLDKELPKFGGSMQFEHESEVSTKQQSKQYTVETVYLKTVFDVSFTTDVVNTRINKPGVHSSHCRVLYEGEGPIPETTATQVLTSDKKTSVYAWLHPKDFERLSSPDYAETFRAWLANLPTPHTEERDDSKGAGSIASGSEFLGMDAEQLSQSCPIVGISTVTV